MTACSYSDVFPLFMAGRLHICSPNKGGMFFRVPGYKDLDRADAATRTDMVPRATGSTERPMSDAAIRAKFDSLAGMVLPAPQAAGLADFVLGIEGQGDCRDLPGLLVATRPEAPVFA